MKNIYSIGRKLFIQRFFFSLINKFIESCGFNDLLPGLQKIYDTEDNTENVFFIICDFIHVEFKATNSDPL